MLVDGCAATRRVEGAFRDKSAQRGEDQPGLRRRADHDAELRPWRHGDGRGLRRHGRRQHDKDADQHYVQETWTDNGHPYFVFAPINACTGCAGKIYLLEHLSGSILQSDLGPTHQVELVYDDTEPFQTFVPMPYCLQDPRGAAESCSRPADFHLSASSGGSDNLVHRRGASDGRGNGTVANPMVDFTFFVYTSYDGLRGAT